MLTRTRLSALALAAAACLATAPGPSAGVVPEAAKPKPIVWLTFDDGPNSKYTPQVLAVLKKYDAHATFFMIGQNASKNSKIVPKVRAGGHTVGNHSVSHPRLTQLSASKLRYEVSHGPRSRCFRPPYGLTNSRVRAEIKRAGMRQILWHIDSQDYTKPGANAIAGRVLSRVRPGSIVLMHDGGGDRSQTVAALDKILRTLKARGYVFRSTSC